MLNNNIMKWEIVKGVITPGGDPLYVCPICRSRYSEHINGVESHCHWNYCPVCGIRLEY